MDTTKIHSTSTNNHKNLKIFELKPPENEDGNFLTPNSSKLLTPVSEASSAGKLTGKMFRRISKKSETSEKSPTTKNFGGKLFRRMTQRKRGVKSTSPIKRSSTSMTNEQRLRMLVLREIVNTEEDYVQLLGYMVNKMREDLTNVAENGISPVCTDSNIQQFLGNVVEVHRAHQNFLYDLRQVTNPYPYHTNTVGHVFLNHKENFTCYEKYCSNFTTAKKISYELEKDPKLEDLLNKWKSETATEKRRLSKLEGFIIAPVQRLCKFPLLLRELIKRTPITHKDYNDVNEAKDVMETITSNVNETQKKAILVQGVRDMENTFDNWERSGNLSKEGFLTKRGQFAKNSWTIRWLVLRGFRLSYFAEPDSKRALHIIDLTNYLSLNKCCDEMTKRNYSFSIVMPDRIYYFYAVSESDKRDWLDILQWKFRCIDRNREQAHKPMETIAFSAVGALLNPKQTTFDHGDEEETYQRRTSFSRASKFLRRTFRSKSRRGLRDRTRSSAKT